MASPRNEASGVIRGETALSMTPEELCGALRRGGACSLFLDGRGGFPRPWRVGPLVAIDAVAHQFPGRGPEAARAVLARIGRRIERRRRAGGPAETGVALLVGYGSLGDGSRRAGPCTEAPDLLLVEVDRSVRFRAEGGALLSMRCPDRGSRSGAERAWDRLRRRLEAIRGDKREAPARRAGAVSTSLPREAYLRAVRRVLEHIAQGEIYQANLCQRLEADYVGNEFELYRELVRRNPAPMSAYLEAGSLAVASASPEVFLRIDPPGAVATFPIKGTRARGATPEADAAARRELLASVKDRAELLMIVDLERNDLGRLCSVGSVRVPRLTRVESFPAVHHLVARVEGRLRPGVDLPGILRATFPGGSITGAPKLRAMEVIREIEPARRSCFTGSLFWFGDDGSSDSSILIRTLELRRGRAWLGAGGGIVADSDPEQEWRESNHKAAALSRALGFDPEEAA